MKIVCHDSASSFLRRCKTYLLDRADVNHDIIHLASILEKPNDYMEPPYWFCTIEDSGNIEGCALYAAPDGLVLSALPLCAAPLLAEALLRAVPTPKRIVGEPNFAKEMALRLGEGSGTEPTLSAQWAVARLNSVNVSLLNGKNGNLRIGNSRDIDLVIDWGRRYGKETPAFLNVEKFMCKKLINGDLYIWDDPGPKSMLTVSGRSQHGAKISSVFTPGENRSHGHATDAVAAMSQSILDAGHSFVVLAWRVGNPASRIYKKLGFYEIGLRHSYICTPRPLITGLSSLD